MVPLPDSGGGRQPASYPPSPSGVAVPIRPILRVATGRFASSTPPQREEVKRMTHLKSRMARVVWSLASLAALAAALGAGHKWG
jgi:hypothetical protein